MVKKYMTGLADAEERELAVTTFDKNVVVTAGAGTGKTTLIIDRIIHLLMREPHPLKITDIVALTFTNKAANEMKIRLRKRLEGLIGTFNTPESSNHHGNPMYGILAKGHESPSPPGGEGKGEGGFPDENHIYADIMFRYNLSRDRVEERAMDAINNLEKAQIGTIHSFAGHILRLHPIEAGIDTHFEEDDGSEFDEHFEKGWEEWLDAELSQDAPRGELWKLVLRQADLESVKSFAREICREILPLSLLRQCKAGQGLSHELQSWICGQKKTAQDIMSRYAGLKKIKIMRLLEDAINVFESLMSNSPVPLISDNIPSGKPPAGWTEQDYRNARQAAGIAKSLSLADNSFFDLLMEILLPFAAGYRAGYAASGNISFDGLLTSCRDLLKSNRGVREGLKRHLKAILVDEFQDTDPVQYEIILYLSEVHSSYNTDWRNVRLETGKIFIVGDPKQSIYAFRRADIEAYYHVVKMATKDQTGISANLSTNFRSHDRILDVVNDIFGQLIRRRELLQPEYERLVESPDHKAGMTAQRMELRLVDGRDQADMDASNAIRLEAEAIGRWLREEILGREIILDTTGIKTAVLPRHIAILFRKLTDVHVYLEVLRRYEIPYIVEGERHFYATQEVIDFVNLLKVIDNPYDRLALVGVLRSPLGGMQDKEICELDRLSLLDYRIADEMQIEALTRLYGSLRRLNEGLGTMSVMDAVNHIFETLPVLELAASSFQGEQAVANLRKIRKIAESLSDRSNLTLKGFTRLLEKKVAGLAEEGESLLAEETVDAVRVSSIHKAKGLEFPVVILPGLHASTKGGEDDVSVAYDWSSDDVGFKLNNLRNHAAVMLHDKKRARDEEEQKRLLYVAMTRARECLVLSGTLYGTNRKGSFLSMIGEALSADLGDKTIDEIVTGDGSIRQSLISPGCCTPRYTSMGDRKSDLIAGSAPHSDSEEVDLWADLWESRYKRYEVIKGKDLFTTPSRIEEETSTVSREKKETYKEETGVVFRKKKEAGTVSRKKKKTGKEESAGRERAILIGSLAHRILEHWDFRSDTSMIKKAVEDACNKYMRFQAAAPYASSPLLPGNNDEDDEISSTRKELEMMFETFSRSPAYEELKRVTIIGREIPFTIRWDAASTWPIPDDELSPSPFPLPGGERVINDEQSINLRLTKGHENPSPPGGEGKGEGGDSGEPLMNLDLTKGNEKCSRTTHASHEYPEPASMYEDGQIMEGVIDLVYKDGDNIYVADYKTDKVTDEDLEEKIREYRLSGYIYSEAVRRCMGVDVAGVNLIFLRAGKSVTIGQLNL